MRNNTVVTIGDRSYLWGVFLLIASMRKSGMEEPVIVCAAGCGERESRILEGLGGVRVVPAPPTARTLACSKPDAMLLADTEFVTWVDSDGFFTGNVSEKLVPLSPGEIHIRMRGEAENALAFASHRFGGDGRAIPAEVLEAWRKDVPGAWEAAPGIPRCCSDCLLSLHRSHRSLLEAWRDQMARVLPSGNVGVVDRRLPFYHQLDESVLNSLLCFLPGAPRVSDEYRLDREPEALFVHFVCHPKPWVGWTPSSLPKFGRYLDVVDYAVEAGLELPGPLPFSLRRENRAWCSLLAGPVLYRHKFRRLLRRIKTQGSGR